VLVVSGSGSCHDRIKRRSNRSQDQSGERRQNLAFQFQSCGSRESLLSTIVIHPSDVPRHRWRQFVDDCKRFVASDWARRAAQLGWNAMSLFGCAPRRPLDYSGSAGLLWALNGGRLVQLHRDWAVIDVPVNRSERVFYRRHVDVAKITLPWRKRD
jgi:hypothetical protein